VRARSRARGWALAALTALVVVGLDQLTKGLVRGDLVAFVDLVRVNNEGVAFGALGGGGLVVALVIAVAVGALLVFFVRHADQPLVWLPTGMLVGGAAGNVVDRVRDGAVTDFVKVPHWPAFNLADAAITLGVLLLLVVLERDGGAPRGA
jgi:signal peptidase II